MRKEEKKNVVVAGVAGGAEERATALVAVSGRARERNAPSLNWPYKNYTSIKIS